MDFSDRSVPQHSLLVWLRIGVFTGALATVGMDLLGLSALVAGVPAPYHQPYIGRWFLYALRGNFFLDDAAQAPALSNELAAYVTGHYLVGTVLGIAYVFIFRRWLKLNPWISAPIYGLVLSFLPWLVMYPAMGYGFFGLDMPNAEWKIWVWPVATHVIYGAWLAPWTVLLENWRVNSPLWLITPPIGLACVGVMVLVLRGVLDG